ncbi:hypothetical protein KPATCC21470_1248 [Kitasatospora purpeofusca]
MDRSDRQPGADPNAFSSRENEREDPAATADRQDRRQRPGGADDGNGGGSGMAGASG